MNRAIRALLAPWRRLKAALLRRFDERVSLLLTRAIGEQVLPPVLGGLEATHRRIDALGQGVSAGQLDLQGALYHKIDDARADIEFNLYRKVDDARGELQTALYHKIDETKGRLEYAIFNKVDESRGEAV